MTFDELNEEQKRAVECEGNILITACPGSGKTRVLIHKLAHELNNIEDHSKKKVVALTFTIRASDEIFRRLNAMGVNSERIWSGTLHAFCLNWILKPYSSYLEELRYGFTIADESFCSKTINDLKEKYGLGFTDQVITRLNRDGSFVDNKSIQRELLAEYHTILQDKGLIDYDLILFYSYKILINNPKIQLILSNLFKLICVDEYQDTQDLLYAIISTIVKAGKGRTSLFLVGDIDQAIYTSLGGVAKTLDEIKEEIDDMPITPLTLSGNYRSNQRIIDFYRHFQMQEYEIEAIGSNSSEEGLISFNKDIHKENIVDEISRLIQNSLDNGIPEDEICVLVPQWWLITSVTKKLRATLPDVNFDASGLAPMSRNRDNIWYKLSRLMLTVPSPKIYSLRYRWATELIDQFQVRTKTEFHEEYRLERNLLRLVNSLNSDELEGIEYLNDCFDQFIDAVEIDLSIHSNLIEEREIYFENVKSRINDPNYKVPSDIESFKGFYREMTGVVINTCVGVKGEEFETVIAYGLLKGYIPHWNEIFNGDPLEASKRLMYVICSRAKSNLHLISEKGRTTRQGNSLQINPELEKIDFQYDDI